MTIESHPHGSTFTPTLHEPTNPAFVRYCDVVIIGGSAAGLASALQLGRQRRSVIVVDGGDPRNASAALMHSFLGRDGTDPAELLSKGRAEVRSYGGEILSGRALRAGRRSDGLLVVELAGGIMVVARRIIVATGLTDELPDVEGLADHWGRAVIHCPFCHGYEARDQRLVQLITHGSGLHVAPLLRQLSASLTVLVADGVEADETDVRALTAAGVDVRLAATARRVITGADGRLIGVELVDRTRIDADTILVQPRFSARAEPFAQLGLHPAPHASGMGDLVEIDASGATTVEGVFAVGSITNPGQQMLEAAAHGGRVGANVAISLAQEDVQAGARPAESAAEWDHRYAGGPLWSGHPNGALLAEVSGLRTGRALDVGAGEGGDAMWLAEQGWQVTASDVSEAALARIHAEGVRRALPVNCLLADANVSGALTRDTPEGFDLVSVAFGAIPRTPDRQGVRNVLDAVAPGGTLVVLSHDLAAMREAARRSRPFDPDAYVQHDDFVSELRGVPGWVIEVDVVRPRPGGAHGAGHHHADDLVLRARRTGSRT